MKPKEAAEWLVAHTWLKIAYALEGKGAAARFAKAYSCTTMYVWHIASGTTDNGAGRPKTSYRIERAIDEYVRRVFAAHPEVLTLEPPTTLAEEPTR